MFIRLTDLAMGKSFPITRKQFFPIGTFLQRQINGLLRLPPSEIKALNWFEGRCQRALSPVMSNVAEGCHRVTFDHHQAETVKSTVDTDPRTFMPQSN